MFGSESSFNWQYSMAKSSHFSILFMNLFQYLCNNSEWVDLSEDGIDFNEANALGYGKFTLTLV